jgi:hypothetical protein
MHKKQVQHHFVIKKTSAGLPIAVLLLGLTACITPPPKIAPPAGTYDCPETVTITDARPGAQIFYTTDGSTPTTASNKYGGPFQVSSTDKVQAIAVVAGGKTSRITGVSYTCLFTRADFAQLIQQRFSLVQPQHPIAFPDVPPSDPKYPAIEAAAFYMNSQFLCPGCTLNRNFFPSQPITRGISTLAIIRIMLAAGQLQLLSRAEAEKILASSDDGRKLPPAARPYFATAIARGVIAMQPGNKVGIETQNTLEEISALLSRIQTQFNVRTVAK